MRNLLSLTIPVILLIAAGCDRPAKETNAVPELNVQNATRGQLLRDGNYAMFIHWGIYSNIANEWKGKTYYGIGEWIMNGNMAGIPIDEYMATAATFNPVKFDARAIARIAKNAGMKYIIITSKHHDGFAMYHSKVNSFNIVDATPFKRDPMKELSEACREEGIGFGFYYSHNQDWTCPGGNNGPQKDAEGKPATFDDYFRNKCIPQVNEITTGYGPIQLIWFDTPGGMPKEYSQQLVDLVHKNQPEALVSGRVGHGLGDYQTLGDMEVPVENIDGLWETVDVTNDSWGFASYDQNWKSPKEILTRVISTVARGGTYMLNVGPDGQGVIPARAVHALEASGEWIKRYPMIIYGAGPSPWHHALPWGDVTLNNGKIYFSVFSWPEDGKLYLPGLKNRIVTASLLKGGKREPVKYTKEGDWTVFELPSKAPEKLVSVIEAEIEDSVVVDNVQGIDPSMICSIPVNFADTVRCEKKSISWMEKFGEWKHQMQIGKWKEGSAATFEVDVIRPGDYFTELRYKGTGRLVWSVSTGEGEKIKNQQNSSHIYTDYPVGWITFSKPGRHTITVTLEEGDREKASLAGIRLRAVEF